MRRVGVGWRAPLASWIASRPPEVQCLEITAEHFFDGGEDRLRELAGAYPIFVHGLGLSLGTPGPLDRGYLDRFARVAEIANAEWTSEHVSFSRAGGVDLGHLNPIPPTRESLKVVADHAIEVAERCGRPLVLENITTHLRLEGEMTEPEYLNRLCEASGCGLLLDATNLHINSRNHGFDAREWLGELDLAHVRQLHVVGYAVRDGRYEDSHSSPLQDDLLDLVREILERAPPDAATIVERDANFPSGEAMAEELRRLAVL